MGVQLDVVSKADWRKLSDEERSDKYKELVESCLAAYDSNKAYSSKALAIRYYRQFVRLTYRNRGVFSASRSSRHFSPDQRLDYIKRMREVTETLVASFATMHTLAEKYGFSYRPPLSVLSWCMSIQVESWISDHFSS